MHKDKENIYYQLQRPRSALLGKDAPYLYKVAKQFPEFREYVVEHRLCPVKQTENIIVHEDLITNCPALWRYLTNECQFKVESSNATDKEGKELSKEEVAKRVTSLMEQIKDEGSRG